MRNYVLLVNIICLFSCNLFKNFDSSLHSKIEQVECAHNEAIFLGNCKDPILFNQIKYPKARKLHGLEWRFKKLNINSFDDIQDSIFINSELLDNVLYLYDRKDINKRNSIQVGDFIVAKNKTRVNIRYVLKVLSQEDKKIKLEYSIYRIRDEFFFELSNKEKFNQIILYSDIETLEELILEFKENINVCETFKDIKMTPLTFAMVNKNKIVFDKLLDLGADVNHGCRGNRTALMYASNISDQYFFQRLIDSGANCSIQDENGNTIYDYIEYYEKFELLKLIPKSKN